MELGLVTALLIVMLALLDSMRDGLAVRAYDRRTRDDRAIKSQV